MHARGGLVHTSSPAAIVSADGTERLTGLIAPPVTAR